MSELFIQNIVPLKNDLKSGSFILIQNTHRIPPHISLVHDGNYFSSSVAGVKTGVDISSVLKNIESKKIPSLILEITSLKFSADAIAEIFLNYGPLNHPDKSCLFPIIDVLNQSYGLVHESEFVFELIAELKKNHHLISVHSLNMDGNHFSFPIYQRSDISFCISQLKTKEKV